MKNIFDFATKELSQDAFLRWFFESYDDPSLKRIVLDFISTFSEGQLEDDEGKRLPIEIRETDNLKIKTYAQSNDIDITVDIFVNEEKYCFVIEDKTTSDEHNQLKRYNEAVEKWTYKPDIKKPSNQWIYKIFYKTSTIDETERKRVKESGWTVFDLYAIENFFSKYKNLTRIQLLNDYIEHLEKCKNDADNKELPSQNNIQQWVSFFEKTVRPHLDKNRYNITIGDHYFGYAYLIIKTKDKENAPYLEFRSRDCLNNHLTAKILLYGQKISDEERRQFKEKIKATKRFNVQNNSQQIGSTTRRNQEGIEYNDKEEFISIVKELIEEYLSIFED